jgi:hypothetical protein
MQWPAPRQAGAGAEARLSTLRRVHEKKEKGDVTLFLKGKG